MITNKYVIGLLVFRTDEMVRVQEWINERMDDHVFPYVSGAALEVVTEEKFEMMVDCGIDLSNIARECPEE